MCQTDAAFRRRLRQLGDGAGWAAGLVEQLADAAGLIGGDRQPLAMARQRDQPIR